MCHMGGKLCSVRPDRLLYKSVTMCFYELVIPTCALNQLDIYAQAYVKLLDASAGAPQSISRQAASSTDPPEMETTAGRNPVSQRPPSRALSDQI